MSNLAENRNPAFSVRGLGRVNVNHNQVEKALTKYGNISTSSKEFEVYSAEGKKLSKDIINNIEFAAPMNNRKNRWNKPDE